MTNDAYAHIIQFNVMFEIIEPCCFILNDKRPKLLFIPGGFAHGYKTLLPDTRLIVFSTSTLSESIKDDYRYDAYYWNPWTSKER